MAYMYQNKKEVILADIQSRDDYLAKMEENKDEKNI